jgi:hypothetical protein
MGTFAERWFGRRSHLATNNLTLVRAAIYVVKYMLFPLQKLGPAVVGATRRQWQTLPLQSYR